LLDYTQLDFKYTRNVPVNTLDEAQTATALKGIVSDETMLGTLSVVTDVEEEMQRIADERENAVNLDEIPSDPNAVNGDQKQQGGKA
jgi:hypothetical protein